ncbi:hypothetical protein GHT06_022431 [Daphnia sinensis]|uniref:Uncharacterized protein n=1 Tax=Daphnia sinensis TaxID=1820382 RepID=A0AAD5KH55_9CRUS|nr:hypothetical protein GHT06_022431 [Daphnia sinensis]
MELFQYTCLVVSLVIISAGMYDVAAVPMVVYKVGNQLRLNPVLVPVSSTVMPFDLLEKRHDSRRASSSVNEPRAEYRKAKREKTQSYFWQLTL